MNKRYRIGAAILVIFVAGFLLVNGVHDLIDKKNLYTLNIDECCEMLVIETSINGLIPMGKDYYYLGINNETKDACIIKATRHWYNKNFDDQGRSYTVEGVDITALSKRISDYEVEKELYTRALQVRGVNYILQPDHSIEVFYKFNAIVKLVMCVVTLAFAAIGLKFLNKTLDSKGIAGKIYLAVFVAYLIVMLVVIT